MTEIVDFIKARIAEDRVAAEAATPGPWGKPRYNQEWWIHNEREGKERYAILGTSLLNPLGEADAEHIARHDPAATVARCDAVDALIHVHAKVSYHASAEHLWCNACCVQWWPCPTLRIVAAFWSSHPDYQQEWKV